MVALLKGKNPSGTYTLKALPATDDPAKLIMPAAAGAGYGVNAKAKNKDLALKFVNFIMSPEGMTVFNKKQGSLPALPDTGYAIDPALADVAKFINDNRTVPFMDQLWPNPTVQSEHLTGVQDLFSGRAKPADVLARMDAAYKKK